MLEGRTADCLAIANTAILMRLVERRHHKARCHDGAEGCWGQPAKLSERRSQQFRGSLAIIRKELMPKLALSPRAG
jgi:hypothetical protein